MESFMIGQIFGTPDQGGNNFFHDICRHGCLSLLLRAGNWLDPVNEVLLQNYNYEGDQCVHIIANLHRGQQAVQLRVLVELGANLNAPNRLSGSTPLHIAVIWQDYELVTWICQQTGVDMEARNYARLTAFQLAWKKRDKEMIDLFWKFGAECEQPYSSESDDDS